MTRSSVRSRSAPPFSCYLAFLLVTARFCFCFRGGGNAPMHYVRKRHFPPFRSVERSRIDPVGALFFKVRFGLCLMLLGGCVSQKSSDAPSSVCPSVYIDYDGFYLELGGSVLEVDAVILDLNRRGVGCVEIEAFR